MVKTLSVAKKETFRDILQTGSKEDILEFLRKYNLLKQEKSFNVNDMLWMLKDKAFFKKVLDVYRDRMIFDASIWSYAFYHKDDLQAMREYLMQSKAYNLFYKVGAFFDSQLMTV